MLGTFSKVMKSTVLYQIDNYDITTCESKFLNNDNILFSVYLEINSICKALPSMFFFLNCIKMEEARLNTSH